jgi:hypothetical protein
VDTIGKVALDELDPTFRSKLMNAFRDWR